MLNFGGVCCEGRGYIILNLVLIRIRWYSNSTVGVGVWVWGNLPYQTL